jgi:two-component system, chemotaxis family, sensor kinase CheA
VVDQRQTLRTYVEARRHLLVRWSNSLATRFAVGTVLLILAVTALVVFELTRREWHRLRESKQGAAEMAAELFASSLAAALDFSDYDTVVARVAGLESSREILSAVVSTDNDAAPIASYQRSGIECESGGCVELSHAIVNPTGQKLGIVEIKVSLERERVEFQRTRIRLALLGFVFSLGLATILIIVARRVIVAPIARLDAAARRLASSDLVEVPVARDDELGRLSLTFNAMARTIDERERRIANWNRRLQSLLDNMGQAIVVFGEDGTLTEEHSRQAERIFGATAGVSILDLLYPATQAGEMEREAFKVWIHAVFRSEREQFPDLAELSPRTVTLGLGADALELDLEFRLVAREPQQDLVMLLATDVTEKRRLERSVAEREREHEAQLSAVRRLVSGGGQLFAGFIESAHRRLETCQEILASGVDVDRPTIEALFQQFHTLRAEARCFNLSRVEAGVSALEALLGELRKNCADPNGEHRATLITGIRDMTERLGEAERAFVENSPLGAIALDQITVRRSRFLALVASAPTAVEPYRTLIDDLAARPLAESIALLPEAVERWADRGGKSVRLETDHRGIEIPFALSRVLGGVLSHLLRNAIAHGIEVEADRHAANKSGTGLIRIAGRIVNGAVSITVSDDGRGFDLDALAARSQALGRGAAPLNLAFESGVTTAEYGELAGAGVGLAAARAELRSVGYTIVIISTGPQGTEICLMPKAAKSNIHKESVKPQWPVLERS